MFQKPSSLPDVCLTFSLLGRDACATVTVIAHVCGHFYTEYEIKAILKEIILQNSLQKFWETEEIPH